MIHKLTLILSLSLISTLAQAQYMQPSNWLPPVTFPSNTDMCDNADWKLVLFDDFNGTSLNANNWITFYSWDGMLGGDHENTIAARRTGNGTDDTYNAINKEENVVVSGGTCKLQIKHEAASWSCDTCTSLSIPATTKYYTVGTIMTPYYKPSGPNYYNSGKFEVKMKMPINPNAHTTIWTWYGTGWNGTTTSGINEIDMAEAYGIGKNDTTPNTILNTYNLHAWGPDPHASPLPFNPHELPQNAYLANNYPNQSWYNISLGNWHNIADWHTYTCEWDTANIKISLDSSVVNNIWKYYRTEHYHYWWDLWHYFDYTINVGSGCNASGLYKITGGYPYNSTNSQCNFRITTGMDGGQGTPTTSSTLLGQAEIDYVKIWQRHPEQDNHTDLCAYNSSIPILSPVTAPTPITRKVTVMNPAPGATWTSSNNLTLVSTTGNSATFQLNGAGGLHSIHYIYAPATAQCPAKSVSKSFYAQTNLQPAQYQTLSVLVGIPNSNLNQFSFAFLDATPERGVHNPYTIYDWTIKYSLGSDTPRNLTTYSTKGKFVSTPFVQIPDGKYFITWQVKVKTELDSAVYSGVRTSQTSLLQQKDDTTQWYFNASITDTAKYNAAVFNAVANNMVGEDADSIDILSMINQIRLEQLEPYIVRNKTGARVNNSNTQSKEEQTISVTNIFPNPASQTIKVQLSEKFSKDETTNYKVLNLVGKQVKEGILKDDIDVSSLTNGIYVLELSQVGYSEHCKFTKN